MSGTPCVCVFCLFICFVLFYLIFASGISKRKTLVGIPQKMTLELLLTFNIESLPRLVS